MNRFERGCLVGFLTAMIGSSAKDDKEGIQTLPRLQEALKSLGNPELTPIEIMQVMKVMVEIGGNIIESVKKDAINDHKWKEEWK